MRSSDVNYKFKGKPKKLTKWKNEPSVQDLKEDLVRAENVHSEHVTNVERWNDLINVRGSAKLPKREGRSSVQPRVIRKQAEWRYSALSEPFLATEDIYTIHPKTWQDVDAAKQNELILNYQFNNQLNKVKMIDDIVRSCVDQGTAIARVSWEYEEAYSNENVVMYSYVEASQDEQMSQQIMQAVEMFNKKDPQFRQLPEEVRESAMVSITNGRPILAIPTSEEEQETLTIIKNQPRVDICDTRNVMIDPTCAGDFDNAQFLIYAFETSLSELKKDGKYANLDDISVDAGRNSQLYHAPHDELAFQYHDKPRKKFVAYEYWGYYDVDGRGDTTPIVATWVGDVMIRMEMNPYPDGKIPFVVIPYLPVKNSIYGEPDTVLLEENQKLTGALTRGMVDAMAKSANAQTGIRKDALDAVNRRKYKSGQDYEFNPNIDPNMAIINHTFPELPQSSYAMLQHLAQEAEALTGIKTFTNGLSGDSYAGQTAAGVQGTLTATGKRESAILRRISKGMEQLAVKVLSMNAEWLSDDEVIRITDENFIAINRVNLRGTFDVKLEINTPENNQLKAQQLSFMLQTMGQMLPFGLTQIILAEIAHLQNMTALSETIASFTPPPDPLQELQQQKLQMEVEMLRAQLEQMPIQGQLAQANTSKSTAQAEQFNAQAELLEVQAQQLVTGVAHQNAMELQQAQAQGNLQRDIAKSIVEHKLEPNKK